MGQGEQPQLAAQLGAVGERALEQRRRHVEQVDGDRVARRRTTARRRRRPSRASTPGDRCGRRARRRDEPDQLAVAVALGAPGLAGAGHDAEAAAEGRQLVEELPADLERRERGRVGRARRGPRRAGGSGCRGARTVIGGSPWRIALVTTSDSASSAFSRRSGRPISAHDVDHPAACLKRAPGAGGERLGGPVQRHCVSTRVQARRPRQSRLVYPPHGELKPQLAHEFHNHVRHPRRIVTNADARPRLSHDRGREEHRWRHGMRSDAARDTRWW